MTMPHTLHAAIAEHLAHGAMAGTDAMTDCLCTLAVQATAEPLAASPAPAAPLTAQQRQRLADAECDPALVWVLPLGVLGSVALCMLLAWCGAAP